MFNMASELGLVGGPGFETSLCNLFPICWFESPCRTQFILSHSPCAGMGPHVKKGFKGMIFILNSNPTSLSF